MQKVGPSRSGVAPSINQNTGAQNDEVIADVRRATSRPVATKDIEPINQTETINGVKISYLKMDKTELAKFGVRFQKDDGSQLEMKIGGSTFRINADTDHINCSIDKAGELKINVVDKANAGSISSREVRVSKDQKFIIGEAVKTPAPQAPARLGKIPFNIPQEQRDKLFYAGIAQAESELQKQFPGAKLKIEATGILAKGMRAQPSINPIELQKITLIKADGSEVDLGNILPEEQHLQTLKPSEEISAEILNLAKEKAGFKPAQANNAPQAAAPQREIPFTLPQAEIDKIFFTGLGLAEEALKKQFPGCSLFAEGSGALAKSVATIEINPIEFQKITLIPQHGDDIDLGNILPEKRHLQSLKSAEEIRDEILELARSKIGYKP